MNIKNQLFLLAIIIAILSQICSASKYNISLSELETCEVFYLDGTSNEFTEPFEVNSIKNNLKKDNKRLHLKFYLMASNTSNILLTQRPYWQDACYQIVLENKNSSIWRYHPEFHATTKPSPNMLSTFDPMPVEIIQTNEGELIVNIPGYAEPLMKYLDPNPVDIKYFRFASYYKTSAKWFYNCEFNENSNKEAQKICTAMDSRITNLTDYFLTDLVKKQTNYSEKYNEDQLLLTSKLSAMDSRITNLTDYFLTDLVKKQTNYNQKHNEDQLLLTSKLSAMDSRITNLTDYFLSDCVETQTNSKEKNNEDQSLTSKLSSTDPSMIKLMDSFLSGTIPLNRHNSFFNGLVPTLNNFDDDQVIEFQQGVIEVMKKIKNGNTPTTTKKAIPEIDVRRGNGM